MVSSTIHSQPDEQIIRSLCLKPLSWMAIGFSFGKVETVERCAKARRRKVDESSQFGGDQAVLRIDKVNWDGRRREIVEKGR